MPGSRAQIRVQLVVSRRACGSHSNTALRHSRRAAYSRRIESRDGGEEIGPRARGASTGQAPGSNGSSRSFVLSQRPAGTACCSCTCFPVLASPRTNGYRRAYPRAGGHNRHPAVGSRERLASALEAVRTCRPSAAASTPRWSSSLPRSKLTEGSAGGKASGRSTSNRRSRNHGSPRQRRANKQDGEIERSGKHVQQRRKRSVEDRSSIRLEDLRLDRRGTHEKRRHAPPAIKSRRTYHDQHYFLPGTARGTPLGANLTHEPVLGPALATTSSKSEPRPLARPACHHWQRRRESERASPRYGPQTMSIDMTRHSSLGTLSFSRPTPTRKQNLFEVHERKTRVQWVPCRAWIGRSSARRAAGISPAGPPTPSPRPPPAASPGGPPADEGYSCRRETITRDGDEPHAVAVNRLSKGETFQGAAFCVIGLMANNTP